jgi:hypothetical protein
MRKPGFALIAVLLQTIVACIDPMPAEDQELTSDTVEASQPSATSNPLPDPVHAPCVAAQSSPGPSPTSPPSSPPPPSCLATGVTPLAQVRDAAATPSGGAGRAP